MKNKSEERYEFRRIFQKYNESFESFVERLQRQAKNCNFRFPEEHIFDQIIEKCWDREVRLKAFKRNFTLEELISESKKVLCTRCGLRDHDYRSLLCKALNKNCENCGKRGHLSNYCRSRRFVPTERPPSRLTENDSESFRKEVKKEPEVIQEALENESTNLLENDFEVVTQIPGPSIPRFSQSSSKEDPRTGFKRKSQDSSQSFSSKDLQVVGDDETLANPKRNVVIAEAPAGPTPLVHTIAPKSYYDCFVGGLPMKLIVRTDGSPNMIGKEQYQKLRNERFTHYHENELSTTEFGDYTSLFSSNIRVGSESIGINIFVKEKLDPFIYVNAKTAKKLKLIP